MNDPYKLTWKVSVEHLKLLNAETHKTDNKSNPWKIPTGKIIFK